MVQRMTDAVTEKLQACASVHPNSPLPFDSIEAAVVEGAVAAGFADEPGNKSRPRFSFGEETLDAIRKKHVLGRQLARLRDGAPMVLREARILRFKQQEKEVKRLVRAEKRSFFESLACEAEAAALRNDSRACYAVIKKLAPKPSAAGVTLKDDQRYVFDADAEVELRAKALETIFDASPVPLHVSPEPTRTPAQLASSECLVLQEDDILHMIAKMPNNKGGPALRLKGSPGLPFASGAPAELWKLVPETVASALTASCNAMLADLAIPRCFKDAEIFFLRKVRKGTGEDPVNDYRTCMQFGGLPGRGTRDAIAAVQDIFSRFCSLGLGGPPRRRPLRIMAVVLFDLSKAFDCIDRQKLWHALEVKGVALGVRLALEELHDGTCYVLRDTRSQELLRKVHVKKGVRQGSTEGPLCFVAMYDLVLRELDSVRGPAEAVTARVDDSLGPRSAQAEDTEFRFENAGDVVFMDDLISFLIFETGEQLNAFVTEVARVFSDFAFKVNASKLEFLVAARGTGCRALMRRVQAGDIKITLHGATVLAKPHTKYLGVQITADGKAAQEVPARIKAAKSAHARLTPRVWRSLALPIHLKTRLWTALVRSILLYASEAHVLTLGQLRQLEATQMRQLRHLWSSPSHVHHVTNSEIRRRAGVHSIESTLRFRRLMWWRGMVHPVFSSKSDVQDHTRGARAVLCGDLLLGFSTAPWESSPRWQLLRQDVLVLLGSLDEQARETAEREGVTETTIVDGRAWLSWLAKIPLTWVQNVLSFESSMVQDDDAEKVACDVCGQMCRPGRGLQTHQYRMHKTRKYEHEISENTLECPRCNHHFSRRSSLIRHMHKCGVPAELLHSLRVSDDCEDVRANGGGYHGAQAQGRSCGEWGETEGGGVTTASGGAGQGDAPARRRAALPGPGRKPCFPGASGLQVGRPPRTELDSLPGDRQGGPRENGQGGDRVDGPPDGQEARRAVEGPVLPHSRGAQAPRGGGQVQSVPPSTGEAKAGGGRSRDLCDSGPGGGTGRDFESQPVFPSQRHSRRPRDGQMGVGGSHQTRGEGGGSSPRLLGPYQPSTGGGGARPRPTECSGQAGRQLDLRRFFSSGQREQKEEGGEKEQVSGVSANVGSTCTCAVLEGTDIACTPRAA